MPTVVGISGSLREGSYNSALLRAAAASAPEGTPIEIESIAGIPLYDGDVDKREGRPERVAELQDRLAAADGLLIVTPEYNWGVPGVVKNAIDWLSRPPGEQPRIFGDLPVALIGAGGRSGTRMAQNAWLPIVRTLGMRPWYGANLFVARAWERFDESLELTDSDTREQLEKVIAGFAEHIAELPRRRS